MLGCLFEQRVAWYAVDKHCGNSALQCCKTVGSCLCFVLNKLSMHACTPGRTSRVPGREQKAEERSDSAGRESENAQLSDMKTLGPPSERYLAS